MKQFLKLFSVISLILLSACRVSQTGAGSGVQGNAEGFDAAKPPSGKRFVNFDPDFTCEKDGTTMKGYQDSVVLTPSGDAYRTGSACQSLVEKLDTSHITQFKMTDEVVAVGESLYEAEISKMITSPSVENYTESYCEMTDADIDTFMKEFRKIAGSHYTEEDFEAMRKTARLLILGFGARVTTGAPHKLTTLSRYSKSIGTGDMIERLLTPEVLRYVATGNFSSNDASLPEATNATLEINLSTSEFIKPGRLSFDTFSGGIQSLPVSCWIDLR